MCPMSAEGPVDAQVSSGHRPVECLRTVSRGPCPKHRTAGRATWPDVEQVLTGSGAPLLITDREYSETATLHAKVLTADEGASVDPAGCRNTIAGARRRSPAPHIRYHRKARRAMPGASGAPPTACRPPSRYRGNRQATGGTRAASCACAGRWSRRDTGATRRPQRSASLKTGRTPATSVCSVPVGAACRPTRGWCTGSASARRCPHGGRPNATRRP